MKNSPIKDMSVHDGMTVSENSSSVKKNKYMMNLKDESDSDVDPI